MKNEFEVRGKDTAIIIHSKKYGRIEALISTQDFETVNKVVTWWSCWRPDSKSFYVRGNLPRVGRVYLHRLVMNVDNTKTQVDHVNRNPLDNRRENLNIVTNVENSQNKKKYATNTSGHRGVTWNKALSKWTAQIVVNGVNKYLGVYVDIDDAVLARKAAEEKYFNYRPKGIAQ
ncbi:hypothetical protein AB4X15_02955 [Peribacillus simplex]|uniref:hypothetical protein n=1 Tax=Peribacillus simplex TaxID=1478 RepID=UPI0034E8EE1F